MCGWLACDGFQTLLALMILSAGQQKGLERTLTLLRVSDAVYHREKGETYLVLDCSRIRLEPRFGKERYVAFPVQEN